MDLFSNYPHPTFSEDHRSLYRAKLLTSLTEAYSRAVLENIDHPSEENAAKVDLAHALLIEGASTSGEERDSAKDRAAEEWDTLCKIQEGAL